MPRGKHIPLTPKEYMERQERSAWIRKALKVQEIPAYQLAAALQVNPNTLYRHLKEGLDEERFDTYKRTLNTISIFRLADGGENRG